MKTIYVFLAEGFEEVEALTPVDVLRRAGLPVKTVSVTGVLTVNGAHGVPFFFYIFQIILDFSVLFPDFIDERS